MSFDLRMHDMNARVQVDIIACGIIWIGISAYS